MLYFFQVYSALSDRSSLFYIMLIVIISSEFVMLVDHHGFLFALNFHSFLHLGGKVLMRNPRSYQVYPLNRALNQGTSAKQSKYG